MTAEPVGPYQEPIVSTEEAAATLDALVRQQRWAALQAGDDLAGGIAAIGGAPAWHAEAACKGADLDLFFPTRGQSSERAKALCAECPVAGPCLDDAVGDASRQGMWAGTTARDRSRIRKQRQENTVTDQPADPYALTPDTTEKVDAFLDYVTESVRLYLATKDEADTLAALDHLQHGRLVLVLDGSAGLAVVAPQQDAA